jgi:hypothetical protein
MIELAIFDSSRSPKSIASPRVEVYEGVRCMDLGLAHRCLGRSMQFSLSSAVVMKIEHSNMSRTQQITAPQRLLPRGRRKIASHTPAP